MLASGNVLRALACILPSCFLLSIANSWFIMYKLFGDHTQHTNISQQILWLLTRNTNRIKHRSLSALPYAHTTQFYWYFSLTNTPLNNRALFPPKASYLSMTERVVGRLSTLSLEIAHKENANSERAQVYVNAFFHLFNVP
jgi:hypothetical protein